MRLPISPLFLAIVVVTSPCVAAADSSPVDSSLFGAWELTGYGANDNLTRPHRLELEFSSTGEFRMAVWEEPLTPPLRYTGSFTIRGGVVTLWVDDDDHREEFDLVVDGASLILSPIEPSARHGLALYFQRRTSMTDPTSWTF